MTETRPRAVPLSRGPQHHFYGYYGINPWDPSLRYHLALETRSHEHRPVPEDMAAVGLVDRERGQFQPYASTSAYNLQQGSMMHWIDAGFGAEFTYNDWEGDRLVSRAARLHDGHVRTIEGPVAAVSPSAPCAIGLNYARMAHCRPVVGYANRIDPRGLADVPTDDGLWRLDLRSGQARLLLPIAEVMARGELAPEPGHRAWFNHVLYNTDGSRLLFFCRIQGEGGRFHSSLWTVGADGSGLRCQIPFGHRISHFAWRDARQILISTDLLGTMGFVTFHDGQQDYAPIGPGILPPDGHASYSPDRRRLVTDTSGTMRGDHIERELMLYDVERGIKISLGVYRAALHLTGDIRCDLHPRWSPDGRAVTFDSVHTGDRQVYWIDASPYVAP